MLAVTSSTLYFSGTEETEGGVCATGHGALHCGGVRFCPSVSLPHGFALAVGVHTGVMIVFFSFENIKGHLELSGSI